MGAPEYQQPEPQKSRPADEISRRPERRAQPVHRPVSDMRDDPAATEGRSGLLLGRVQTRGTASAGATTCSVTRTCYLFHSPPETGKRADIAATTEQVVIVLRPHGDDYLTKLWEEIREVMPHNRFPKQSDTTSWFGRRGNRTCSIPKGDD
jgi:hypothetical protein